MNHSALDFFVEIFGGFAQFCNHLLGRLLHSIVFSICLDYLLAACGCRVQCLF